MGRELAPLADLIEAKIGKLIVNFTSQSRDVHQKLLYGWKEKGV